MIPDLVSFSFFHFTLVNAFFFEDPSHLSFAVLQAALLGKMVEINESESEKDQTYSELIQRGALLNSLQLRNDKMSFVPWMSPLILRALIQRIQIEKPSKDAVLASGILYTMLQLEPNFTFKHFEVSFF